MSDDHNKAIGKLPKQVITSSCVYSRDLQNPFQISKKFTSPGAELLSDSEFGVHFRLPSPSNSSHGLKEIFEKSSNSNFTSPSLKSFEDVITTSSSSIQCLTTSVSTTSNSISTPAETGASAIDTFDTFLFDNGNNDDDYARFPSPERAIESSTPKNFLHSKNMIPQEPAIPSPTPSPGPRYSSSSSQRPRSSASILANFRMKKFHRLSDDSDSSGLESSSVPVSPFKSQKDVAVIDLTEEDDFIDDSNTFNSTNATSEKPESETMHQVRRKLLDFPLSSRTIASVDSRIKTTVNSPQKKLLHSDSGRFSEALSKKYQEEQIEEVDFFDKGDLDELDVVIEKLKNKNINPIEKAVQYCDDIMEIHQNFEKEVEKTTVPQNSVIPGPLPQPKTKTASNLIASSILASKHSEEYIETQWKEHLNEFERKKRSKPSSQYQINGISQKLFEKFFPVTVSAIQKKVSNSRNCIPPQYLKYIDRGLAPQNEYSRHLKNKPTKKQKKQSKRIKKQGPKVEVIVSSSSSESEGEDGKVTIRTSEQFTTRTPYSTIVQYAQAGNIAAEIWNHPEVEELGKQLEESKGDVEIEKKMMIKAYELHLSKNFDTVHSRLAEVGETRKCNNFNKDYVSAVKKFIRYCLVQEHDMSTLKTLDIPVEDANELPNFDDSILYSIPRILGFCRMLCNAPFSSKTKHNNLNCLRSVLYHMHLQSLDQSEVSIKIKEAMEVISTLLKPLRKASDLESKALSRIQQYRRNGQWMEVFFFFTHSHLLLAQ